MLSAPPREASPPAFGELVPPLLVPPWLALGVPAEPPLPEPESERVSEHAVNPASNAKIGLEKARLVTLRR